ncbi:MAG TPA: hypothetical protein VGE01_03445 [Fimbriimonas sp.]
MTAWPSRDALQAIPLDVVGALVPSEVLYYFDGPCIFWTETAVGTLVLAYLSEDLEAERSLRYVISTTSTGTIAELKRGVVSVREAMERGSLWIVDLDYEHRPVGAYAVRSEQLPEDALPLRGTMLWSELEPAMIVRLEGAEVQQGRIPAAAFSQAAEIAGKALKPVFEWAARRIRQDIGGRPPEWLRDLYAMPTQRVAFGSLEVAFGQVELQPDAQGALPYGDPNIPTPRQIQAAGWDAIREGLAWAASEDADPPADGGEDKWLAILEALRRLAPSSSGPVTAIQVWGAKVGRMARPYRLDRTSAKRIRTALTDIKKRHEVRLRVFTGRIRDLDLDEFTLILRDIPDEGGDVKFILDEERLLETAREAHYQELEVSARSEDEKTWTATDIEFVRTNDPSADGSS